MKVAQMGIAWPWATKESRGRVMRLSQSIMFTMLPSPFKSVCLQKVSNDIGAV
jgi:hypothetical protein